MAKINRYSQITPSRYNPLSLEEIMMVPLIKRKQHDDLLNGIALTREGLATADPLDVHAPLVGQTKEQIEQMLQEQAERAAMEGISGNLRSDFIDLNAKYQNEMGAMGTIGKANAIKLQYEKDKAEALANATQIGHNPSATQANIDREYENYVQNYDGKTLESIPVPKPPNYRRVQELLNEVKPLLGSKITTDRGDESYEFIIDPKTKALLFRTESGQIVTKTNNPQLEQARLLLQEELNGEWGASNEWNGITPEQATRQLNAGIEMMKQTAVEDTRQNNYQIASDMNKQAGVSGGGPNIEKWSVDPLLNRDGDDGGNPLKNKLLDDPYYNIVSNKYGLSGGVYEDSRPEGERGANYRSDGLTSITGEVLEDIIMDPRYKELKTRDVSAGMRGSGIFDPTGGDNLVITPTATGDQLAIEGTYKGKYYSLTIQDKQVTDMYRRYGTSEEGRQAFNAGVKQKRKNMNDLREAEPYLSNATDKEIAQLYTDAVNQYSVYQQNVASPENPNNTYYKAVNRRILGAPGTGNLGALTTSKVRIFTEDGSELLQLNGSEGVDYLANLISDNEYDDLNVEEQREVLKKLQQSHNHGVSIGDHEFTNEINYSFMDKNGKTVYFKVENNTALSGKDGSIKGINDASQMMKYLVEGKAFVSEPGDVIEDEYGNEIKINKYFAHIPYQGHKGFEIRPVVVYSPSEEFSSLAELTKIIDPETMKVREEYKDYGISIEDMRAVSSRVGARLMRYYNSTPGDGITNKEAQENNGY